MPDYIPIRLDIIERRAAQQEAKFILAEQVASKDRFIEDVERGFNPAAAERTQARLNRFRTLDNRRRPTETQSQARIQAVETKTEEDLAQQYSKRNPELPPDRLRQLRDSLRRNQTSEQILKDVLKAFGGDATLADEALEYLERASESPVKENVRRARELLNEERGREVIAGRNVDSVAKAFYKKGIGSSPTDLRELYRDITGDPRDHNTLFSELSDKYPFDQLKLVVAFLLKGLGYDLKSKGPSIQQAELMRLMTEMRNLQSILWVYLFFKSRMGLLRNLFSQYGLKQHPGLTFEALAKEFIRMVEERYPSVLKLMKQAEKLGLDDLSKILVFMQYRDAIRQLSPRLYKSLRHRQDLLLVILEAMEALEEEEEEGEDA